jgi:hypothetical protein
MTVELLTPWGALIAIAGLVPCAALYAARRRSARGRRLLGLEAPRGITPLAAAITIAAAASLFGIALTQPVVRTTETRRVRTDAEVLFILDTSRSMLARASPDGPDRLSRARDVALSMRAAVPEVPTGIASLTDRVLPHLFPTADPAAFSATAARAIGIERPPPLALEDTATDFDALARLSQGFFTTGRSVRVAVVLTDGETRAFDAGALSRALGDPDPITLVVVRLWSASESVYRSDGAPESRYRPDPASAASADTLARITGGVVYGEDEAGEASAELVRALGRGPSAIEGTRVTSRSLAPYATALGVVPLLGLLAIRGLAGRSLRRPRALPIR